MSQFETGLQEIGLGSTQANSLFNATVQQLTQELFFASDFLFGAPVDGTKSAGDAWPCDRVIKYVSILAMDAGALPAGTSLLVQVEVNGALLSQTFALGAAQTSALVAVVADGNGGPNPYATIASDPFSGPGILIPATQPLKAQISTAAGALNVLVKVIWRPRKI